MNNIKLLRLLTALPLLGVSLMPLSSCGCSSTQYIIIFDTQGGSAIDSVKVKKDSKVTKPTDPTKQGYVFKGWFTEKECTNQFDFNTPITSNITLYAKWENQEVLVTSVTITNTIKEVNQGNELELTAEVKPDDAANKELDWIVTDGTGTATIITEDKKAYLKGLTPGIVSVQAKAKDGSGTQSTAVEFNIKPFTPKEFAKTDLSIIISAINTFENSAQDKHAMRNLCANFTDTAYIEEISSEITDPNRQIEAHLGNFIGKTTSIKINEKDHEVRVIGINHDLLQGETNKYAAFTFEMVTLLSDVNGYKMTTKWDLSNNYDYTNSALRCNLNGAGSGTKPVSDVWTTSAFQMLPSELQTNIKSVNKKVATYDSQTSEYVVSEEGYNDKLFPLTYTEMAQSGSSYAKEEGSAYTYWIRHNTDNDRIKKDVGGEACHYWLCSPSTYNSEVAWVVSDNGGYADNYVFYNFSGVSFGFCI